MLAMPGLPPVQPVYQQPLILNHSTPQSNAAALKFEKTMGQKFKIAVYVAGLFMILSSNAAFRVLNQAYMLLTNSQEGILDEYQCATLKSSIVMGCIMFILTFFFILK